MTALSEDSLKKNKDCSIYPDQSAGTKIIPLYNHCYGGIATPYRFVFLFDQEKHPYPQDVP